MFVYFEKNIYFRQNEFINLHIFPPIQCEITLEIASAVTQRVEEITSMDMDITAEAVDDVADILTKLSDLNISDTSVRDFNVDSNSNQVCFGIFIMHVQISYFY